MKPELIIELLKEYKRVIIPDFGTFILKESQSAHGEIKESQIVVFNDFLKYNDGFLIDQLARRETIDRLTAGQQVNAFVARMQFNLTRYQEYTIPGLGTLYKDVSGIIRFKQTERASSGVSPTMDIEREDLISELDRLMSKPFGTSEIKTSPKDVQEQQMTSDQSANEPEIKSQVESPGDSIKMFPENSVPTENREPDLTLQSEAVSPESEGIEGIDDAITEHDVPIHEEPIDEPAADQENRPSEDEHTGLGKRKSEIESGHNVPAADLPPNPGFLHSNTVRKRKTSFKWLFILFAFLGVIVVILYLEGSFQKWFADESQSSLGMSDQSHALSSDFTATQPQDSSIVGPAPSSGEEVPVSVSDPIPIDESADIENNTNQIESTSATVVTAPKNYHIIAASFRELEKAEEFMTGVAAQGYSPRVLADDKGNFRVSYLSFQTRQEALQELPAFRERVNPDAWFLFFRVDSP
jgi:nucleoid DNA-binding protein